MPLHCYCHSHSAQMGYKGSQGAIVKIIGKAIFFYEMHFLITDHTVALDVVKVKKNNLDRLFSAVTL